LTAAVDSGLVVLGTSLGNLYWVTHTAVPVGLHVQKIVPQTGLWNRFFGSTGTGGTAPSPSSHHVLPLSDTEFVSLSSLGGSLVHWKVSLTVASAHHATFEPTFTGTLMLAEHDISNPKILRATLATDQQSVHCILRGTSQKETKLFWIQAKLDGSVTRCHWLSRFAEPYLVNVLGLTTTENNDAYGAFYQSSPGVVIVMVLIDQNIIHEVDLPTTQVPSLLPNVMERDNVTHGCSMMAASGIGLRVRYLPHEYTPPSAKKARLAATSSSNSSSSSNPTLIHTLVSHLRSSFWQAYQDPEAHRPMPPSLRQANASDLEQAIVAFCTELQHKGDASSAQNPMEWHRAFVKLLQEGGLYRSVSQLARWQLLSIGQELAVFGYLTRMHQVCKSYDIADWLLELQTYQTEGDNTQWNPLLAELLDTATAYRDECANPVYDVVTNQPAQPIWMSHTSLQTVLLRQLEEWRQSPSPPAERGHMESVVKAALQSYSESYDDPKTYAKVQGLAIGLLRLRSNNNNNKEGGGDQDDDDDELAFELSIQYQYFEGLCQIAVDHEKKRDATSFSLDPLFATPSLQGTIDLLSGFSFPQFVLQWHTDAGLYGHAINYGRHSPADLTLIMNQDERLREYRWIPAIRQGYFDQATESCLANCDLDKTLGANQWALSMAKLANQFAAQNTQTKTQRQRIMDRQFDLIHAQQMLQGEETAETSPLRTPEDLVHLAMQQLQLTDTMEERVRLSTIALAVCASMDDPTAATDHTAHVWAESLRLNSPQWDQWIKMEIDLTNPKLRERIMVSTVFGTLLQECRKDETMSQVTYGRHIEGAVVNKVGSDSGNLEFARLLRSVTRVDDSIQAQSLVVASY
jgi:hypothetical protein